MRKSIQLTLLVAMVALSISTQAQNIILNIEDLVTYSQDFAVAKISNVRAQLLVASRGGFGRIDCYKSYHSNFPYAAQTESFTITQNLKAEISDEKQITLSELQTLEKKNRQNLTKKLHWGCKVDSYTTIFVEGELDDQTKFKSNLSIRFDKDSVILEVGSSETPLTTGQEVYTNLTPTVFFGENWNRLWDSMNPTELNPVTNY